MVLHCLKCWLHFLRWLNYSSALGRADLSSGSWHLVEWLQQRGLLHLLHLSQQRFCLCLWGGQGLSPTYTFCAKSHVSLLISHKFVESVWIKTERYFSWKLLPNPLCVCQKGIKLHHTRAERKILFCWNFIFQSQAFSCIRLFINLGCCIFDLFTLCLQHMFQLHFLLNGLWETEEP